MRQPTGLAMAGSHYHPYTRETGRRAGRWSHLAETGTPVELPRWSENHGGNAAADREGEGIILFPFSHPPFQLPTSVSQTQPEENRHGSLGNRQAAAPVQEGAGRSNEMEGIWEQTGLELAYILLRKIILKSKKFNTNDYFAVINPIQVTKLDLQKLLF